MASRIKLHLAAASTAAALAAVLAPTATAAVIADRQCYREGSQARFLGAGFQPGQPVAITLDAQQLATQRAGLNGVVAGSIPTLSSIPRSERRRSLTMSQVTNPAIAASVTFTVTQVYVITKPRRFKPGRRLRIRAGGFYGAGTTLYAHVRGPRKRNFRIGTIKGPCGKVSATRKVILRRRDPVGLYPTQFDTLRTYRGRAVPIGFRKVYSIRRVIRFSRGSSLAGPPLGRETWVPGTDSGRIG